MYFNINVIMNDYNFRKPGVYDISTEPSGVSRYVINNPGMSLIILDQVAQNTG